MTKSWKKWGNWGWKTKQSGGGGGNKGWKGGGKGSDPSASFKNGMGLAMAMSSKKGRLSSVMNWLGGAPMKRSKKSDDSSDSSSDSESDSEEKAKKKRKEKREKRKQKKEDKALERMKKMYAVMNECTQTNGPASSSSSSPNHGSTMILTPGDLQVVRLLLGKFSTMIGDASTWGGICEAIEAQNKNKIVSVYKILDPAAGKKAENRKTQTAKTDMAEAITEILKTKVKDTRA